MNDFCEVGGRRIRAAGVAVGGFYFFFLATFSSWLSYGKVVEEVMAQETALSARLRELSGKAPLETRLWLESQEKGMPVAPVAVVKDALAPPPPPAPPAQAPATSSTGANTSRPLTGKEKYQEMLQRLHLPLTKEPDTARPSPHLLTPGLRLRVQWSDGWWKAEVLEEKEDVVKVRFDTWGPEHDEWISRQSERLRLALPNDTRASDEDVKILTPANDRPYVPKPFNPEKEFQKRQLRIREKVAAMQKSKLGYVDPQLSAKIPVETPSVSRQGLSHECSQLREAPPLSPEAVAQNVQAAEELLAQAEAPPPPRLDAPEAQPPQEPQERAAPDELGSAPPPPHLEAVTPPEPSEAPPQMAQAEGRVRWEERLDESKERYYYEVATGQTQSELPAAGWVALLDDDGTKYYWDPELGTTQWDPP